MNFYGAVHVKQPDKETTQPPHINVFTLLGFAMIILIS